MIIRYGYISLHLLMLTSEVLSEVGVAGGFAILPCSAKEPPLKTEDVTVNWRYDEKRIVFAINKGKGSVQGQDPKYSDRAETFPEEYEKGNFSLKLKNLQSTDAGKYQCYIMTPQSAVINVELLIKVPLKVSLERTVGGSVDLPCSSNRTAEGITVNWRHNESLNVFDIIKGEDSVEKQDSSYVNRTESFPQEYRNGNYSLKLNNLQRSDTGNYTCYITKDLIIHSMELRVKDVKNQGVLSRPQKMATSMALLSVFTLLI